ncbi:MAG: hypothetical protein ACRCZ9_02685 [Fusobacteriaceae bacterium]
MKTILENLIKEFNERGDISKLEPNKSYLQIISKNINLDPNQIMNLLEVNGFNTNWNSNTIKKFKEKEKILFDKFLDIIKTKDLKKIKLLKIELNSCENKFIISINVIILLIYKILGEYRIKIDNLNDSILSREFLNDFLDKLVIQTEDVSKNSNLNKQIIDLQKEINKYEIEIENLKNQINNQKNFIKKQIILEFFREMNSSLNNELLDNFHKIGILLNQLENKDSISVEDLESISLTIKLFFKYLKKNKVVPKENIGNVINITLENAQSYKYIGSEFINSCESKKVKIETSGWEIKDEIITKPTVKEVN